jgi:hypothetical protein
MTRLKDNGRMKTVLYALSTLALASALTALPASATVIKFTTGMTTPASGVYTATFDDALALGLQTYTAGIATYRSADVESGSVSGQYATPPGDGTYFLTVGSSGNRSTAILFSSAINYFGFYGGSPDSYNSLVVHYVGAGTETFSGSQLTPLGADGSQSKGTYVSLYFSKPVSEIDLASSSPAFETDNHSFGIATPEPATVGLLGVGLLALGAIRARRRAN